jgi:PAS domain S-box-containing protein
MSKINTQSSLTELRVLYVEDDIETREELQSILEQYVAKLYTAKNGQEGLILYREYLPDIVVTDIQMPVMNGLSMAADIRAINPEQPIVILSAYNDVEYLFRALELEIQHYITKPISVERLLNKLSELTAQINQKRELASNRKLLEQYKSIMDEKAIIAKIDPAGTIIYVNKHFCELSGHAETELLGRHFLFGFEKNEQQEVLADLEKTLHEKRKWQGILRRISKAGATYVVDVTFFPINDSQNNFVEYFALMVDITDIYQKFERLSINLKQDLQQQSHYLHEYEHALEIGTSLCVIDTDGIIVSANRNFSSTLNYQPEELLGRSLFGFMDNYDEFKARVLTKVKEQGYTSRIIKVNGKDGIQHTLSSIIVGIHNQQGELHSIMSLNQDISDCIKLNDEIIETQKELIYILGEVAENRSRETGLHIKRVALICELLAQKYGLDNEHSTMIKVASPLHDIGKIGIPDQILHKAGELSKDEFEIMKTHADMGFHMLNKLDKPLIKMAATIAHEHHEFYNGEGYPTGLCGEHIAIEARIVSLVDVFDALSSKRIYKEAWSDAEIIKYLISNKSIRFDPELVDLFLENFDEILAIRNQYVEK